LAAQLRAEEHAGPSTTPATLTRPQPESDDESEDGDFPMVLCGTGPRTLQSFSDIAPARAEALARHAEDIANLEDFGEVLGRQENNYEALGRAVWDLHDAALHFHAEWQAGGRPESLARAQSLAVKHKVLDGLCTLKQQHRDWIRRNPQVPERVLHHLRDALDRCRTQAGAAAFPIQGFDAPLQEVEHRMQAMREDLERDGWVRLPGDLDATEAHARRIRAWRNHGQAIEACHGPQDWEAIHEVVAERRLEAFAHAQAQRVPGELLAAMRNPLPQYRLHATAAALRPLMEPVAWALARQVHSETVRAGLPQPDGGALEAAELRGRLEAFAAALAGPLHRRLATGPFIDPGWGAAAEGLLRYEMAVFARNLALRARSEFVMALHSPVGHAAANEATLQAALRPDADTPARAAERAAMRQRLMQACRALGELAAELRAALRGPPAPPASGAADTRTGGLEQALQALQLADVPVCGTASARPATPPPAAQALQAAGPGQPDAGVPTGTGHVHRPPPAAHAEAAIAPRPDPRSSLQPEPGLASPDSSRGEALPSEAGGVPASPGLAPAEAGSRPEPAIGTRGPTPQQKQAAAVRAALAPFLAEAQRCTEAAQACRDAGPAAEPAWEHHSLEFAAWQKAVLAHDACSAQVAAQADALRGPTAPEPPAVRRLRRTTAQACRDALAGAAEAARHAWEAFSQACDDALVQRRMPDDGLAGHCRKLHAQWRESPLRERLPELEARMTQYIAFEIACRTMQGGTETDVASALAQARQLRVAMDITRQAARGTRGAQAERLKAFAEACSQRRDALVCHAVCMETQFLAGVHDTLDEDLVPALQKSRDVSTLYDTLLAGDPLGEEASSEPVPGIEPAEPAADKRLAGLARETAQTVVEMREWLRELPSDSPPRAVQERQATLATLRQGELRARTAETMLAGFHKLSRELAAATPARRPAIAKAHADELQRLLTSLDELGAAHVQALGQPLGPVLEQVACSGLRLRADLRLAELATASVRMLEQLLQLRLDADQTRRDISQGRFDRVKDPAPGWDRHRDPVQRLDRTLATTRMKVDHEGALVGEHPGLDRERTCIDDSMRRLKCKAECEEALIRAELLMARAERVRRPETLAAPPPFSIPDLQESVTAHTQALRRANEEVRKIGNSLGPSHAWNAQLKINLGCQRRLLELQEVLRDELARAPQPPGSGQAA
jgi:hypothetical protein